MTAALSRPDTIVLRPYGRFDALAARAMLAMVPGDRMPPGTSPRAVVLDLSSATEMTSGALAALISGRRRAWQTGTLLRLRCKPGPVLDQFERSGLHRVFEIELVPA